MARRRRREAKVIRKTIPKIFTCPRCGIQAVSVIEAKASEKEIKPQGFNAPSKIVIEAKASEKVRVVCGNCGLSTELEHVRNIENVDYFNRFADKYHRGEIS